jgi:hypothetical protein
MKIIDVLNKIANGEEVPKTIMYDGDIWKYDELSNDYEIFDESDDLHLFREELNITRALNDEVEILEEDKKIEKVNTYVLSDYDFKHYYEDSDSLIATEIINRFIKEYSYKINEIIDYLNREK